MSAASEETIAKARTPGRTPDGRESGPGKYVVLILSTDPVAAALLGALVETLGYMVLFYHPPDAPDEAMRRARPSVALIDCADPTLMNDEVLGRAKMRGVSVLIFGSPDALRRVRQIAHEHALGEIVMPASAELLDEALQRAVKAC
jgi:DNA-binding NtrC family response regulator